MGVWVAAGVSSRSVRGGRANAITQCLQSECGKHVPHRRPIQEPRKREPSTSASVGEQEGGDEPGRGRRWSVPAHGLIAHAPARLTRRLPRFLLCGQGLLIPALGTKACGQTARGALEPTVLQMCCYVKLLLYTCDVAMFVGANVYMRCDCHCDDDDDDDYDHHFFGRLPCAAPLCPCPVAGVCGQLPALIDKPAKHPHALRNTLRTRRSGAGRPRRPLWQGPWVRRCKRRRGTPLPHLHQPDSRGHVGGILEPQVDAAVGIELNAHHLQDIAAPRKQPYDGRARRRSRWSASSQL